MAGNADLEDSKICKRESTVSTCTEEVVLSLVASPRARGAAKASPPLAIFSRWCDALSRFTGQDMVCDTGRGRRATKDAEDNSFCSITADLACVAPGVAEVTRSCLLVNQGDLDKSRRRRHFEGWLLSVFTLALATFAVLAVVFVPFLPTTNGGGSGGLPMDDVSAQPAVAAVYLLFIVALVRPFARCAVCLLARS
eukprot:TRINITY_DN25217_c0_g1_i1.p1 TRINITY_DN25217_c0_g1~~TRINITY_DN25217_c0_g1_i1.p1  ORF type:complete len:215 (-),score=31.10 TRINITY_DN25217_c0_g1_i1:46-633(-)